MSLKEKLHDIVRSYILGSDEKYMLVGFIYNMLINFIGNYKCIVFFGKVCNYFELIICKHLSARI